MTNAASRLPRRVYWRRRLGVLIVLAAVALLVSQVVSALDRRGALGSATKPAGPAASSGAVIGPSNSPSSSAATDHIPAPTGNTANSGTANGSTATSAPSSRATSAGSHPTAPAGSTGSVPTSHASTTPSDHPTSDHPTAGNPNSSSHTPSPSTSSSPPPPPSCTPAQLRVAAVAEQTTYSPGQEPVLFLEATNTAATPCVQSFGARTVELTVYNGQLRVWGSNDCPSGGTASGSSASSGGSSASVQQVMPSGVTVKVRVVWSGKTSQPGCTQQRVPANAGNYSVYGSLAGHLGTAGQFALR